MRNVRMTIWLMVVCLCLINSPAVLADCPSADLTGDCYVNLEDLAVMANLWLTGNPNVPDDMVYIPNGGFAMGDHHGDGWFTELPVHVVLLDTFFMSRYEITNQQYCDYLNSALGSGSIYLSNNNVYGTGTTHPYCSTSPSSWPSQIVYSGGVFTVGTKGGRDMSDDPMVMISWYGAVAYCNWRSGQEGYEACYNLSTWECDFSKNGYRLPTEAEWEYASRGGLSAKRFPWGDTITHSQANYYSSWSGGSPYYSYDVNPTEGYHPDWNDGIQPYTSEVGSFSANGYGLYDMAGNVWDWCNDRYDSNYYNVSPYDNPEGPASGTQRVRRSTGWGGGARFCRTAFRGGSDPDLWSSYGGFRIALDLN